MYVKMRKSGKRRWPLRRPHRDVGDDAGRRGATPSLATSTTENQGAAHIDLTPLLPCYVRHYTLSRCMHLHVNANVCKMNTHENEYVCALCMCVCS